MIELRLVLIIISFILIFLAAIDIKTQRINFGWMGLALFILSTIIRL